MKYNQQYLIGRYAKKKSQTVPPKEVHFAKKDYKNLKFEWRKRYRPGSKK